MTYKDQTLYNGYLNGFYPHVTWTHDVAWQIKKLYLFFHNTYYQ